MSLELFGAIYYISTLFKDELRRPEEEMLSLRPYTTLSTAAARPFNRPSDWRRSCVCMSKHQISGEQGRSSALA